MTWKRTIIRLVGIMCACCAIVSCGEGHTQEDRPGNSYGNSAANEATGEVEKTKQPQWVSVAVEQVMALLVGQSDDEVFSKTASSFLGMDQKKYKEALTIVQKSYSSNESPELTALAYGALDSPQLTKATDIEEDWVAKRVSNLDSSDSIPVLILVGVLGADGTIESGQGTLAVWARASISKGDVKILAVWPCP